MDLLKSAFSQFLDSSFTLGVALYKCAKAQIFCDYASFMHFMQNVKQQLFRLNLQFSNVEIAGPFMFRNVGMLPWLGVAS